MNILKDIHPNAKIGQNVEIGNFTTIYDDVEIGDNTWIGPNVTIFPGARIGKNCRIFPGAVISAIPQDLKFEGEKTTAVIGDNNTIREYVTINRGTKASGETRIGDNNLLMAYVHVAHDCIVGSNCILANNTTLAGHIVMGDYAIMGGKTAILQFVHIGAHVITAGGSLVDKDIPPYVKAARYPISYAGINSLGLHRRGFSQESIDTIQNIYRLIFQSGMNVSHAKEQVRELYGNTEEGKVVLEFLENANVGIMKGYDSSKRKQ